MNENVHELAAIWVADVNAVALVDECRRRVLGRPSLPEFEQIGDELIERAVWARRLDVGGLVAA